MADFYSFREIFSAFSYKLQILGSVKNEGHGPSIATLKTPAKERGES